MPSLLAHIFLRRPDPALAEIAEEVRQQTILLARLELHFAAISRHAQAAGEFDQGGAALREERHAEWLKVVEEERTGRVVTNALLGQIRDAVEPTKAPTNIPEIIPPAVATLAGSGSGNGGDPAIALPPGEPSEGRICGSPLPDPAAHWSDPDALAAPAPGRKLSADDVALFDAALARSTELVDSGRLVDPPASPGNELPASPAPVGEPSSPAPVSQALSSSNLPAASPKASPAPSGKKRASSKPGPDRLTDKQRIIFDALNEVAETGGTTPALKTLAKLFGQTNPGLPSQLVSVLEEKGLVRRLIENEERIYEIVATGKRTRPRVVETPEQFLARGGSVTKGETKFVAASDHAAVPESEAVERLKRVPAPDAMKPGWNGLERKGAA